MIPSHLPRLVLALSLLALAGIAGVAAVEAQPRSRPGRLAQALEAQRRYRLAADYSRDRRGLSLLVLERGRRVFEEYHNGHGADRAHRLFSGTKSFSGVMAAAAVEDGILSFDERVSDTITEWRREPGKRWITVRQLLSFTSGLDPADELRGPRIRDKYAYALTVPLVARPGTTYTYGPSHLEVFGELMRRKLSARREMPLDYLRRRVLDPIGLDVARWTTDRAGNPHLPFGAFLTTREWAKFGELLRREGRWQGVPIVRADLLAETRRGSAANPAYGLTFWLNAAPGLSSRGDAFHLSPSAPADLYMAAGANHQRLYVIPSRELVVVRQADGGEWDDDALLDLLLYGERR